MGICLNVSSSCGSSLNDTSWATSAKVLRFNVHVRLMTIGLILEFALRVPLVCRASLRGS